MGVRKPRSPTRPAPPVPAVTLANRWVSENLVRQPGRIQGDRQARPGATHSGREGEKQRLVQSIVAKRATNRIFFNGKAEGFPVPVGGWGLRILAKTYAIRHPRSPWGVPTPT